MGKRSLPSLGEALRVGNEGSGGYARLGVRNDINGPRRLSTARA